MIEAGGRDPVIDRGSLLAVFLISAGALAYEVLLVRLLSIGLWQQVVPMVISLALLGYGASGSLLTVLGPRLRDRYSPALLVNAILFAIGAPLCAALALRLPFNALEVLWDPSQWLLLLALYLLLALPFLFAANCVVLALAHRPASIGRTYGADLLGAGAGAVTVLIALQRLSPGQTLLAVTLIGLAAAGVASIRAQRPTTRVLGLGLTALLALACLLLPADGWEPAVSPYKPLAQALAVTGAELVEQHSSPYSLLTVVANDTVPLRHAPDLALSSPHGPPPQLAVFRDAANPLALERFGSDPGALSYVDWTPAALPYHLGTRPARVLLLGVDAGWQLPMLHDAAEVTVVEPDAPLLGLLQRGVGAYGGIGELRPGWRHELQTARSYLAGSVRRYDLIQARLGGGDGALQENFLATVEGLRSLHARLADDGVAALTLSVSLPPRYSLRLLVTAREALRAAGAADPSRRLAMLRGWSSAVLLLSAEPLTESRIAALRDFAASRGLDLVWYPGVEPSEVNRRHRLAQPWFHTGAEALLGASPQRYARDYKFDLSAATDDRPYLFSAFRWRSAAELLTLRDRGGLGLLELHHPLLLATLAQAMLAGAVLILLPLVVPGRRTELPTARGLRGRVLLYFGAVGLAFLFVEIAFIQRLQLLLGHPVHATAVAVSGFLVFAGLGSLATDRWLRARRGGDTATRRRLLIGVTTGIVLLTLVYLWVLPALTGVAGGWPPATRLGLAYAVLAPLAVLMGVPFPLGLAATAELAPALLPWAWAVNGCASVLSAVLAGLIAVDLGFSALLGLAALLYLGISLVMPATTGHPEREGIAS